MLAGKHQGHKEVEKDQIHAEQKAAQTMARFNRLPWLMRGLSLPSHRKLQYP